MKVILGSGMGDDGQHLGVSVTPIMVLADFFVDRIRGSADHPLHLVTAVIEAYDAAVAREIPTLLVVDPGVASAEELEGFLAICKQTRDKERPIKVFPDLPALHTWLAAAELKLPEKKYILVNVNIPPSL